MEKEKKVRFALNLDPKIYEKLKNESKKTNLSVNELIRHKLESTHYVKLATDLTLLKEIKNDLKRNSNLVKKIDSLLLESFEGDESYDLDSIRGELIDSRNEIEDSVNKIVDIYSSINKEVIDLKFISDEFLDLSLDEMRVFTEMLIGKSKKHFLIEMAKEKLLERKYNGYIKNLKRYE